MARQFLDNSPPPTADPVVGKGGMMSDAWARWFARMPDTLSSIPARIAVVELRGQNSSISATDYNDGALAAGLYRATYYALASAGTVTVTFRWTDGGSSRSWSGTDTSGTVMFRSDVGGSVSYAASYVGSGSYSLDVVLERIKAE